MARTLKVDLIKEIKDNLKSSMGGCGSTLITGTTQVTGNWYAIVTSGITEFDVSGCVTDTPGFPAPGGDNFVVGTGTVIFGNFTAIELDSGSVTAYIQC